MPSSKLSVRRATAAKPPVCKSIVVPPAPPPTKTITIEVSFFGGDPPNLPTFIDEIVTAQQIQADPPYYRYLAAAPTQGQVTEFNLQVSTESAPFYAQLKVLDTYGVEYELSTDLYTGTTDPINLVITEWTEQSSIHITSTVTATE